MSQTFSEENHEKTEELKIAVNQMTEVVDKLQKDFKKMKQTADQQYLAIEEGRNESENLREKITTLEKKVTQLQQLDKLRADQVLKLNHYVKNMEKNQQMISSDIRM